MKQITFFYAEFNIQCVFQTSCVLQGANRGCELQDRGLQGQPQRQGLSHGVPEAKLQWKNERCPLQAENWTNAPDQSSSTIFRYF